MKTKRERLEDLLGTLTAREEFILERRFFQGETLKEIGEAIGVHRSRVHIIEGDALRKLRRRERQQYLNDEITLEMLWGILLQK